MTSGTTELVGFEELQPEPCDGTGEDAMSNRYRKKWHMSTDVRRQDTTGPTSRTSQLIGLEELQPEPCDGTGDDVMSTRVRRKWLKAADLRGQDTTSSTNVDVSQLVGLEELQPELCDGTGEDAMSTRFRKKGLKGDRVGSQSNAELQAVDYAAFGAWFMGQCLNNPEARRMFAMWQQSIQPGRPRRKLLNSAVLTNVISAAAQKRLEWMVPATKLAEIYVLNKKSQRIALRKLEACDSASIGWGTVTLRGPHGETCHLHTLLFRALCEHSGLVFPEVIFEETYDDNHDAYDFYVMRLTGIERLHFPSPFAGSMYSNDDVARLIRKNQDSLKVLEMPMELFSVLPPGLKLEEFITRADPYNFEAPRKLDTKVFRCKPHLGWWHHVASIPPAFLRTVIADEVHLEMSNILPDDPDPPASQPPNFHVKKLAVDDGSVEFDEFYFDRIIREVFAMCPALECFELVSTFVNWPRSAWAALDHGEVDSLIAKFEQEVEECVAPFTICFKALFASFGRSRAEVSDNVRQCFDVDLPPACRVHEGREHYHLVKETCFDKKSLRIDFKISVEPCW